EGATARSPAAAAHAPGRGVARRRAASGAPAPAVARRRADERNRPLEFSARGVEQGELLRRIEEVRGSVPGTIGALTPAMLDADHPESYDGRPILTRQFLIHLLGHLNYHLGQIDYLRRVSTGDGAIALASLASSSL
ncbi:MAG: hypothetical protein L0Y66_10030, partial [Myxococcaceae bacterium]|nr:hypothetical protein [Myxococcaceae bacterium]MCI0673412.1 hypothetical protein [Myxococcaceae bacterium]